MTPQAPAVHRSDLVLVLSFETWADAVRREFAFSFDRLVVGAAADPRIDRLLVADPWRSAPRTMVRRLQGRRTPDLPRRVPPTRLISPLHLTRRDPTDIDGLMRAYCAYDQRLERAAHRLGLRRPPVITGNPFVAAFAPLEWAGPVTYYGFDDWGASPPLEPLWPAIEASYSGIRENGRRVAAVTQAIVDRIRPTGAAIVVPNGLDPDEWRPPWSRPASVVDPPRPLILYIGAIGHRLDIAMLEATAERFSEGEILCVGTVVDPDVAAPLAKIPNLRIEGHHGRREIAGFVHCADVCIMPHHRTTLTQAMSPLKIYEYLAAGRPVVATDLPPVRAIDPRVVLVPPGDAASFAEGVARALALGPAPEGERCRFVADNSWAHRHDQLLGLALAPDADTGRHL